MSEYLIDANPIARFTLFHNFVQVKDELEAGRLLSDLNFNINKIVTIEKDVGSNEIEINYEAKKLSYSHRKSFDKIRVNTKNKCLKKCILLFNDNFSQNWRAFQKILNMKYFQPMGFQWGF